MSPESSAEVWKIGDRTRLPLNAIRPELQPAEVWNMPYHPGEFDLESIDVYTNTDCPFMCDHCFLTTEELLTKDRMSLETVSQITAWATLPGSKIKEITLLGGEFSMHPEAAEIVKLIGNTVGAHGEFLRPRIVTNGGKPFQKLLEDPMIAAILRESRVAVSIEATDPGLNDKFRGRGAAKNAWQTVDMLTQKNIPVDINCTVMRSTAHDAIRLADRAYSRGAKRINFHSFSPIGRGNSIQSEAMTAEEWGQFCDLMVCHKFTRENDDGMADFTIDVEFAYDYGVPSPESRDTCAIDDMSNLQFRPPKQGNQDCAVLACGLTMPDPDKSAYIFRNGNLYRRLGLSEHSLISTLGRTCCPLPFRQQPDDAPQPVCIYTRVNHGLAVQGAYTAPDTSWTILGEAAHQAYRSTK